MNLQKLLQRMLVKCNTGDQNWSLSPSLAKPKVGEVFIAGVSQWEKTGASEAWGGSAGCVENIKVANAFLCGWTMFAVTPKAAG